MSSSEDSGDKICSAEEPTETANQANLYLLPSKNNMPTSDPAQKTLDLEAPLTEREVLETVLQPRSQPTKVSSLRDRQGQDFLETIQAMRADHDKKPLMVYFVIWKNAEDIWSYRARYEDVSTMIGNIEQAKHNLIDKNLYNG